MAMTEEEVQRLASAFTELTAVTSKRTAEERQAEVDAAKFAAKMQAATNVAGSLADAFITYNKEIYKGSSAAKASAASTDKMAEAAVAAGAGLALLMPGGPLMKAVVAGLGLLAAKIIGLGKEVQEQTGEIYKAFQTLAKVGATGAGGMQAVFDSLQKVGLGTEKFAEYLKLVTDNSTDLALIGGTVKKGADLYAESMASLTQEQRITMERMVGDRTAQAEAVMGYIKQQRLLTLGTKAQMDMSSAAVMRYIKETDELARITGINRAEQEKLVEQSQRNEAFQASLNKIRREQGEAAYQQVLNAAKIARAAGEETFAEFTDSLSGFVGATDRAGNMMMASGGASVEIFQRLRNGEVRTKEQTVAIMQELFRALGKSAVTFENQAEMMNFETSGLGKYYERLKAMTLAEILSTENLADAQSEVAKMLADPLTAQMAKAENTAREAALIQQRILNNEMDLAIDAISRLADAAYKTARALSGGATGGQLATTGGGAAVGTSPTLVGRNRPITPGTLRARQAENAAAAAGGSAAGTGQLIGDTSGLNPNLVTALENVAADFGQPIKIGEGFRTRADQENLWANRMNNPYPVARPGTSQHESGNAVDIDKNVANTLHAMGLLEKHGLARPVRGDPVHIQLAKFENGGYLEGGKLGIAGERGPELITGPSSVTSNNDIMAAFDNMSRLLERSLMVQENIARATSNSADFNSKLLSYAQN